MNNMNANNSIKCSSLQLHPPQQRQERLFPVLDPGGLLRPHHQGMRLHGMRFL